MTEREIFEKMVLNQTQITIIPKMMLWLLLLIAAEVKKGVKKKIDGFRKKLMIPVSECPEHEVKSKIGKIL